MLTQLGSIPFFDRLLNLTPSENQLFLLLPLLDRFPRLPNHAEHDPHNHNNRHNQNVGETMFIRHDFHHRISTAVLNGRMFRAALKDVVNTVFVKAKFAGP